MEFFFVIQMASGKAYSYLVMLQNIFIGVIPIFSSGKRMLPILLGCRLPFFRIIFESFSDIQI